MFRNSFVQMLVDLQKSGTVIYLTDEGYREFLKLIREDALYFDQDKAV